MGEDSDIGRIDGGYKLLTSTDSIIQYLAWSELVEIANWRYQSSASNDIQDYLNSVGTERTSEKFKSIWSTTRQACKRLDIT